MYFSIQQLPFFLDMEQLPQIRFKPYQRRSKLENILKFTNYIKFTLEETRSIIHKFQKNITKYYNQKCTLAPVFNLDNKIFLDFLDIHITCSSVKLSHHCLRPCIVEKQVELISYHLKLPPILQILHLVFPVVKLTLLNKSQLKRCLSAYQYFQKGNTATGLSYDAARQLSTERGKYVQLVAQQKEKKGLRKRQIESIFLKKKYMPEVRKNLIREKK